MPGMPGSGGPMPLDGGMIHLRLIVPADRSASVYAHLATVPGVAHLIAVSTRETVPAGDVILCDVAREAANGVVEWLQEVGVHHDGGIMVTSVDAVVSDAAAAAEDAAPGQAADALVWEQLEATARDESALTASFLVFIAIATVIAGVGILLDAPILIVGAMVVGPEYGPLAALCVSLVRRRRGPALLAARTLATGLAVAAGAAVVSTAAFRASGLAPGDYALGARELTAFIAEPDGMAVVVAVLAGIVGMLSLTEGRSGALIGVLVSVTTIPAVANVGVAAAYGAWPEVGGAAAQLGLNLVGLLVAGVLTLAVQARATKSAP
jgi:uncharacterized hydrophobic protein (TIGR00271 family)